VRFINVPVTAQWTIDGTKAAVVAGPADIRAKNEGRDAGHLILMSETHPNYYQALSISGVVDPKWIEEFFGK